MRPCRQFSRCHNTLINTNINIQIHHKITTNFTTSTSSTHSLQQYQHEKHFVIKPEYSDIFDEHGSMVIPHIANRTSTKISVLSSPSSSTIAKNAVLLLRSNNDNNLQECLTQLNEFLNQDIIEIRPASLQPLILTMIKYIRNQILPANTNVDMFIDSYSSEIYIRGNNNDKELAIQCINKLLSPQHLKIFTYLFSRQNIISKQMIQELCNKYHIFFADNFANPHGSKIIQYYLSCAQQSKMHFFMTELAAIAQVCFVGNL